MKTRHLVLIALIMFLSGCGQGGPCGCRSAWVEAPPECGGGPKPDCEGNACADVKINYLGQGQGNEVKNNGTKKVTVGVQWYSGFGGCDSWSTMTLGPGQGQPSFFESYCRPIRANYADPSAPTNPALDTPKIVSFTITPNNVTAGASVNFHVVLSKPAPTGGTRVAFSSITKTGVTSTMKDMPQYWDFKSGVKEATAVVRTERATNETTNIIWTAFNNLSKYSAELIVR